MQQRKQKQQRNKVDRKGGQTDKSSRSTANRLKMAWLGDIKRKQPWTYIKKGTSALRT